MAIVEAIVEDTEEGILATAPTEDELGESLPDISYILSPHSPDVEEGVEDGRRFSLIPISTCARRHTFLCL